LAGSNTSRVVDWWGCSLLYGLAGVLLSLRELLLTSTIKTPIII